MYLCVYVSCIQDMTTIKEYVTAGATDPPEKLEMKEKLMVSLHHSLCRLMDASHLMLLSLLLLSQHKTNIGFPPCLL